MTIELPRGLKIDIDNVPENLEELVAKSFAEYTEDTHKNYTYQDKLCYIDVMVQKLHHADSTAAVNDEIKARFEYELEENGIIADKDEFFSQEFMEACYDRGTEDNSLYSRTYFNDCHANEKVMKILVRVIKAVINWEEEA